MLRVLHHLGNVGMTGVETFLLTLAGAQRRAGLEPAIACAPEGRDELIRAAATLDAPVVPLVPFGRAGFPGPLRKLSSAADRALRTRRLVRELRERRIDVLHLHPVGIGGLEAILAARYARVPLVLTHHATLSFFAPLRSRLSDLTFLLEKRWAHRVVLPYQAAEQEMIAHGMPADRTAVIPFGVDLSRFQPPVRSPVSPGQPFRLLISARLVPGKGHVELLEAIRRLRPAHPGLRLTIAGGGPLEDDLRTKVTTLGLADVVELAGHRPTEEMPGLLARADALVLPSYMEGETFPISLLEGMALGLPTIGTRWFGIPDIIADSETGYLTEPRDVVGLAGAIDRLIPDPVRAHAMGVAGQARTRERFSIDEVASRYLELYRSGRMT